MTENRQRIEAGDLLNLELGHRVRNLFALVNGLITLAARTEPAAKLFASTLRDRFTSLSRALEYIIPSPQGAGVAPEHTLKGLLRTLLTPYEEAGRNTPRFVIEGDDTPVGPHATTSLALSVHELATNAVKYGALVEPAGLVTVTVRCLGGECEIRWTEQGGPPVGAPPDRSGFGSQLLQRSVSGPLGGHLTWDWRCEGLSLRLVTPLALLGR